MKKRYLLGLLPVIVVGLYFSGIDLEGISGKLTDQKVNSYISDSGEIEVYFCPHEDCETALADFIGSAKEYIHCALFELDLELVQNRLLEKSNYLDVKVITDNDYLYEFDYSFVKTDTWGLMHNKFCIIDGKRVSSGSMNPTVNGATKNNNNLLLIESSVLAANYEAEFQEMWNGTFKKGEEVLNPQVNLGNITISSYFCPEDHCAERVKAELKKATSTIHFMTFSFTHEGIANTLLLRNQAGVVIKGVMEARQISQYSKYLNLKYQDIDVVKDGNKQNMHHKVFIVDSETVITGSFNPSAGGDTRNDENVLIIKDKA
ncbi:MAG: hypothetical protein KJ771_07725, partial [Nanoarchaeota archaeon]|nr:hypothetical protein [Nanoarchaeota archaeon]